MPAPVPFLVLHRVRAGVGLLLSIDPPVFCMTCLVLVKKDRSREREKERASERESERLRSCCCAVVGEYHLPPAIHHCSATGLRLEGKSLHHSRPMQVKYGTSHTAKTYQFEPVDKLSLDSNKVSGHQAASSGSPCDAA